MRSPFLYHPDLPLSDAELTACRLDGLLHEVGEGFMPADLPETAGMRAASLALLLRPQLAAAGPSAAWVHGAGDAAPLRHHARVAVRRRLRAPSTLRLRVHESVVAASELMLIGGIRITSPSETLLDLARGMGDEQAFLWLAALVRTHPGAARTAYAALQSRTRMPGKHAALAALDRAYEEVTR